jgi:CheY-like chemotaxis protein
VEDNDDVAKTTAELLRDMGLQAVWVRNATAALAELERDSTIEMVLSDIVMPGAMSGLELAQTLRERYPELPVVLATGYSEYGPQLVKEGLHWSRNHIAGRHWRPYFEQLRPSVSEPPVPGRCAKVKWQWISAPPPDNVPEEVASEAAVLRDGPNHGADCVWSKVCTTLRWRKPDSNHWYRVMGSRFRERLMLPPLDFPPPEKSALTGVKRRRLPRD